MIDVPLQLSTEMGGLLFGSWPADSKPLLKVSRTIREQDGLQTLRESFKGTIKNQSGQ